MLAHKSRPSISSWLTRSSLLSSSASHSRPIHISDPIPVIPADILEEEITPPRRSFPSNSTQRASSSSPSRYCASLPSSPSHQQRPRSRPPSLFPAPPPPPPPFEPILLQFMPHNIREWSQTIIIIDTATDSIRTTWATAMAHPSNLSRYLQSLLQLAPPDSAPSLSDDPLRSHLAAHIFLDRPSQSYSHILQYLRTPSSTTPSLPHSILLQEYSPARIDALVALRDEANYLDLPHLYRLCSAELSSQLGFDCSDSPKSASFPHFSNDLPRENHHERKRASAATTAVDSPILPVSSTLLDDYFPPAAVLKARTRSNSRSSKLPPLPPPKTQSGWI